MERFAYQLAEVAELTGVALNAIEKGCRAGVIPHCQVGRARVMTPEQIRGFLAAREVGPASVDDELQRRREEILRRSAARRRRTAA